MAKAKKSAAATPRLIVAPPPPKAVEPGAVALILQKVSKKKALDAHTHSGARDGRGTATRTEIRRESPRVDGPRQSLRPAERSNQPRSHKAGTKTGGKAGGK